MIDLIWSKKINVGDKVQILQSKFITGLKHRKKHPVLGTVVSIDGAYIYVRPYRCTWEIEAYDCELRKPINLNRQ